MEIKLHGYEVMSAIEDYIRDKYDIDFVFEQDCCDYPTIDWSEDVYAPKKHKNGRVVKHPDYGHVMQEIVGREKKNMMFTDDADFSFYLMK